jgi:hypothetical protein
MGSIWSLYILRSGIFNFEWQPNTEEKTKEIKHTREAIYIFVVQQKSLCMYTWKTTL